MKTVYVVQDKYVDEPESCYIDILQFDSRLDAIDEAKRIKKQFDYMNFRVVEREVKSKDTIIEQL